MPRKILTSGWLSGDDPMTGAQASYLEILCEQAGIPDAFNDNLTKSQASKMIDEMREKANERAMYEPMA